MMFARLLQHRTIDGSRSLVLAEGENAVRLSGPQTTRHLALAALREGWSLVDAARSRRTYETVDLYAELEAGRFLAAIDHPDPARLLLAGTGLTHLGSAEGRDAMHKAAAAKERATESMRMFLEGVEGGKPHGNAIGQQPEWFFKGDGQSLVGPGDELVSPAFAQDGGEEPELAGIYLIDEEGTPWRLGVALANEFSDHVTERHNYLWLAHSKLRQASLGAELLLGDVPGDIRGTSRLVRDRTSIWEKSFVTGEDNMSHSLANLEAHHFKYPGFRRPGDVHVHFFGTATLSFSDAIETRADDVFEITAGPFALPLRNRLSYAAPVSVSVKKL